MNRGDETTPQTQAQTQSITETATRPTGHNGLQNDNPPNPSDPRNGPTCFRCGEQGHMRAECRKRVFYNHCRSYNHDTKQFYQRIIFSPLHRQFQLRSTIKVRCWVILWIKLDRSRGIFSLVELTLCRQEVKNIFMRRTNYI